MNLDDFDRKILREIQRDASRSTREIAEAVGLSQAPCWRRLQQLRNEGFIRGKVALLDRKKLGLNVEIFAQVKMSTTGRANVDAFNEAVRQLPEVLECFVLMGSIDFMLRIVVKDNAAYERFFYDRLSVLPGVQEINTMPVLSEVKATTELPVQGTPFAPSIWIRSRSRKRNIAVAKPFRQWPKLFEESLRWCRCCRMGRSLRMSTKVR